MYWPPNIEYWLETTTNQNKIALNKHREKSILSPNHLPIRRKSWCCTYTMPGSVGKLLPAWMCDLSLQDNCSAWPHTSIQLHCELLLCSCSLQQHKAGQSTALWTNTSSHHSDAIIVLVCVTEKELERELKGGKEGVCECGMSEAGYDRYSTSFWRPIQRKIFLNQSCW